MNPQYLARVKARLAEKDPAFYPALKQLLAEADEALTLKPVSVMDKAEVAESGDKHDFLLLARYWWPNPATPDGLPYVWRDGETNPEIDLIPDAKNLGLVIRTTATLGLAYYFTENEKYAQKSAELLRVWFLDPETRMNPNGNFSQVIKGRGIPSSTGIISFVGLGTIGDNVGLLAGSPSWTVADQDGMRKWMGDFYAWLTTSKPSRFEASRNNNHGVWYDAQVVAHALFLGRTEEAKEVLEQAKTLRINRQIEPDGQMPEETKRTRGVHYCVYCLNGFFRLAQLGDRVGVDLWRYQSRDGRSIRQALDWMMPYLSGEVRWPYLQINPFEYKLAYPLLLQAGLVYDDKRYQELGYKTATDELQTSRLNLILAPLPSQPAHPAIPEIVVKKATAPATHSAPASSSAAGFDR